jgi:hypothetical protein
VFISSVVERTYPFDLPDAISRTSYSYGYDTNELTNISPPPARRIEASFLFYFDMLETLIIPNYFWPVIV